MTRAHLLAAALVLALVPGCKCSSVGAGAGSAPPSTPTAPPPPSFGPVVTVTILPAPSGATRIVVTREGHDPVTGDVPAHPTTADVQPLFADVPHTTRLVVVGGPDVPYAAMVGVLDALRGAGYRDFAISR